MFLKTPRFILIFVLVILLKVNAQSGGTDFNEVHDAEDRLRRDLMKQYSMEILPPHNSTSPIVVHVDLHIVLIKDLDAASQTLSTENLLHLYWNDSRLAWKPANYANIGIVRFPSSMIWQPDVHLYNSGKMNEMDSGKTHTFTVVDSYGGVWWVPPVTLYSLCSVDLKYYPYDKHVCKFEFGSWTFSGDNLDVALHTTDQTSMHLSDVWNEAGVWEIVDSSAVKNIWTYSCCNNTYPDVTYSVTLQRRSPFYKAAIGCPLIAAIFLVLTSLWISPLTYHRIILLTVSFFTAIALVMHLRSQLPPVGKDLPLILTFCGILLMISALAIVCSTVFWTLANSKKTGDIPDWMQKVLQNRILNFICILTPIAIGDRENQKVWLAFFQLIDRIFFGLCLIIIFATSATSV